MNRWRIEGRGSPCSIVEDDYAANCVHPIALVYNHEDAVAMVKAHNAACDTDKQED